MSPNQRLNTIETAMQRRNAGPSVRFDDVLGVCRILHLTADRPLSEPERAEREARALAEAREAWPRIQERS